MKQLNILLADDDVDDRAVFIKALQEVPIPTLLSVVNNGEQLMNYLSLNSNNPPDVLFLDLIMPRKSGLECLTEIAENKKLNEMRIVMFSTSYSRGDEFENQVRNLFYKKGAAEYIRKSADFGRLKSAIAHSLSPTAQEFLPDPEMENL